MAKRAPKSAVQRPILGRLGAPRFLALGAFSLLFVGVGVFVVLQSRAATACSISAKLVPSCGALWGFYTSGNGDVRPAEATLGRKFDIVHAYHDFSNQGNSGVFPTALEKTYMDGSRIVFFNWESRLFGQRNASMPAPGAPNSVYTYRQITSGQLDGYIDTVANRLKATGKPVFLSYNHEVDDAKGLGSGSNVNHQAAGTAEEYVAAWRRIVDRFRAAGATNVVYVWVVTGYQSDNTVYQRLYPGDNYVDWIGYDPYNFYSCGGRTNWKDVPATFGPFYSRLDQGLLGPIAADKPRMLAEFGSHDDLANPKRNGDWYASIPGYLETRFPKIKALVSFNATGICPTHVLAPPAQAATQAGYMAAGKSPYLNRVISSAPAPQGDSQPPTVPQLLAATPVGNGQVKVTWAVASDNVGVTGYRVTRDGGYYIGFADTPEYVDTTLHSNGYHTYVIYAVDAAGNKSGPSAKVVVKVP